MGKAVKLSTTHDRLCVIIGYDSESFADDLPALKQKLLEKGHTQTEVDSMKLVFAGDPNIVNGGNEDDRGFIASKRPYTMVWLDPKDERLEGKKGKAYFRARGRAIEEDLGTSPIDMLEVVPSTTQPEFFSLEEK